MRRLTGMVNRDTGLYLIFGGLTTAVNYGIFGLLYGGLGLGALAANAVAFVAAVLFAFVTNKVWVFRSPSWSPGVLWREVPAFVGGRIFSFLLEMAGLWLAEDVLALGRFILGRLDGVMLAKLALAVIVVALNYIFGKLIFRKNGGTD